MLKRLFLLPLLALVLSACGASHTPPNLSPESAAKWHATRAVKALDTIRDVAIAANEVQPPLVSTDDTRIVVQWHKSAITIIGASPSGWKPALLASEAETLKRLKPDTSDTLRPYVGLLNAVLKEVK